MQMSSETAIEALARDILDEMASMVRRGDVDGVRDLMCRCEEQVRQARQARFAAEGLTPEVKIN